MREYLNNPDRLAILRQLIPILREADAEFGEDQFNELALQIFRYQFERCGPFRKLVEALGCSAQVVDYREIPAVPTDAFKLYRMACFDPRAGEIEFHTSGTTNGKSGIHVLPTPNLYNAAAMRWFGKHIFPENERGASGEMPERMKPLRFISLTGAPSEMPHSSLVHMIGMAGRLFSGKVPDREAGGETCSPAVDYFYKNQTLESERMVSALADCIRRGEAALIFTTAFALVHFLEALEMDGMTLELAEGSRIMETGGYKGRARNLDRDELYEWASELIGVPTRQIVNEYGMTEMSSQFYDRTLSNAELEEADARIKLSPPWVRSMVIDPVTRNEVAEGEIGILRHVDLANLDSCAFLQTADAARKVGAGFELLGRLEEAEQRGCSLDYEESE